MPALKLDFHFRAGTSITCTEPSPWQATNNSSPWNAMSIGWLPTVTAVCFWNDGSIRLIALLFKFDTAMKLRPGASLDDDIRHTPGPSHPIISTHPDTGCNSIFLGRRHAAYVNGCTLEESEALLDELWALCTQPQFCYEHQWAKGDVVVWDNRCTVHRREPFDPTLRRVLYAAQVEGHRPFEAPNALSRPAHPRAAL